MTPQLVLKRAFMIKIVDLLSLKEFLDCRGNKDDSTPSPARNWFRQSLKIADLQAVILILCSRMVALVREELDTFDSGYVAHLSMIVDGPLLWSEDLRLIEREPL
jgi:hypothetical protein